MKDLLIRTATGISLIVLVAGSILLGQLPFLLIIIMIYLLSIRELLRLQPDMPLKGSLPAALSGGLFFLTIYLVIGHRLNPLWFLLPAGIWITGFLSGRSYRFAVLALLWIFLPLALFYQLGWLTEEAGYQPVLPLSLIILVWINDTFAFLTGKWIGKHQMTPVISPGKTWEGFMGGFFFTMLAGWVLFSITDMFFLAVWLLFSLVISVFGLWGDLFESRLKRNVNLKNTASLLPGHGGILDRFDSLFFSAPPFFVIILLMQFCGR